MTPPRTVMVVDDDQALRDSVCELLEDDGYRAVGVGNGATALGRLKTEQRKPDLILLDLMMPGMNGWQFREAQMHDPSISSIPVVVMTATRDLHGMTADEVVYKPLKLQKLLDVVERRIGRERSKPRTSKPVSVAPTSQEARRPREPERPADWLLEGGEMIDRIRTTDWSKSPLGVREDWSPELQSTVKLCLGSRHPAAIFWGPEMAVLYNDAWRQLVPDEHARALGRSARDFWPEIWGVIGETLEETERTGLSTWSEDRLFLLPLLGRTEERYFSCSFCPVRSDRGKVEGTFVVATDTTARRIAERRLHALRALAAATAPAQSDVEACRLACKALADDPADVPFAFIYLFEDDGSARLAAAHGIDPGPVIPATVSPDGPDPWSLYVVRKSGIEHVLDGLSRSFDALPGGPWPDSPNSAVLLPITEGRGLRARGVFVAGVSPRRPLDDDYRSFLGLIARHISDAALRIQAWTIEAVQSSAKTLARERPPGTILSHLEALLMQAPVAIAACTGPDFVYELANPRYVETFGGRELLGKTIRDAFPELPPDAPLLRMLQNVYATGEPFAGEDYRVRLDRRRTGVLEDAYFQFSVVPIRQGGKAVGLMMAAVDVTAKMLAYQRLESGEEKFKRIVTQVQVGIAQMDLSGRFTLVNDRFREFVGRSAEELSHLREADITHPDDLQTAEEQFQRLVEQGVPYVVEKRYVKPDGSIVWVQNSVSRLDDRDGVSHGTATVTIDISQRRFAERALRESEERYRHIFETTEVSMWDEDFSAVKHFIDELVAKHAGGACSFLMANPSTVKEAMALVRLRDVNPATLRLFEAPSKDALGPLNRYFVSEAQPVFLHKLIAIAEGKRLFSSEASLRTLSGRRVEALLTATLPAPDESFERVLVTLVDISSRKVAEIEREAHVAEMEHALEFTETFVGILGHDLRTPLSAIMTTTELLLRKETNERVARSVERIRTSADRMVRMIDQILDFTRARLGGGIMIEAAPVDLRELATEILAEFEGAASHQIVFETSGDTNGEWDRDRLAQVISNLLGNAVEHGEPAQPIRLRVDGTVPDVVRIAVESGGAVPQAVLPNLFDPFRAVTSTHKTRKSKGLGLGLYIVQQIVEAHGGGIDVRTNAEEGTTFFVSIPRKASRSHGPRGVPAA